VIGVRSKGDPSSRRPKAPPTTGSRARAAHSHIQRLACEDFLPKLTSGAFSELGHSHSHSIIVFLFRNRTMAPLKYNYVKYDFRKQSEDIVKKLDSSRRGWNSLSAKEMYEELSSDAKITLKDAVSRQICKDVSAFTVALFHKQCGRQEEDLARLEEKANQEQQARMAACRDKIKREGLRHEFAKCAYGTAFPPLGSPIRKRTCSDTSSTTSAGTTGGGRSSPTRSNGTFTPTHLVFPPTNKGAQGAKVVAKGILGSRTSPPPAQPPPPPPAQPPPPPPAPTPPANYAVGERVLCRWGGKCYLGVVRRVDGLGYHVHWECETTMSVLSGEDLVAVVQG
jgi:hypothetical protein